MRGIGCRWAVWCWLWEAMLDCWRDKAKTWRRSSRNEKTVRSGQLQRGFGSWYTSAVKLADFPEVQALSTREKLELVDELWQDLARELDKLDVTAEEKKILDDRWADFIRNPSSALTLEQLQERVK